jgi:DNA-binding transcriptional ArsR family regulator
MVRDPFAGEEEPDLQEVLDALDDPDCRDIVSALDRPMTASEISEASGVPLSTAYRKIDRLKDAELLLEGTEIRSDGQHASRYEVDFEEVIIALTENYDFEVEIAHRPREPDERLESLWSEVRKET